MYFPPLEIRRKRGADAQYKDSVSWHHEHIIIISSSVHNIEQNHQDLHFPCSQSVHTSALLPSEKICLTLGKFFGGETQQPACSRWGPWMVWTRPWKSWILPVQLSSGRWCLFKKLCRNNRTTPQQVIGPVNHPVGALWCRDSSPCLGLKWAVCCCRETLVLYQPASRGTTHLNFFPACGGGFYTLEAPQTEEI